MIQDKWGVIVVMGDSKWDKIAKSYRNRRIFGGDDTEIEHIKWEGNVGAPFPGKKVVATLDRSAKTYTFEYTPCDARRWKQEWKRSKKRFETIDDAVRASGLWMQICFDNDWPIAVRLVEE